MFQLETARERSSLRRAWLGNVYGIIIRHSIMVKDEVSPFSVAALRLVLLEAVANGLLHGLGDDDRVRRLNRFSPRISSHGETANKPSNPTVRMTTARRISRMVKP